MKAVADNFEVSGLNYRLYISDTGNVCFTLTGGATPRGIFKPHFFMDMEESVEDVDLLVASPFRVFGEVKQRLLTWIAVERPYQFHFRACNARRLLIYRWMARRLARLLPDYQCCEYAGDFYFYRMSPRSIQSIQV